MPRRRQWTDEACDHVMNRGHNRERIFGDDENRRQFSFCCRATRSILARGSIMIA
jgi:hypothetical protein